MTVDNWRQKRGKGVSEGLLASKATADGPSKAVLNYLHVSWKQLLTLQ